MRLALFQQNDRETLDTALLLSILVIVGFWLRIRNLGELGLIADEGFQGLAVQAILKSGVPKLDSGYIYLRAPLFLYAQTALAKVFALDAFWLRFPSVLCGTASILPAYLLGKHCLTDRSVC
jgi:4-amino-4-deoxy-L-arabinose transferase-like glycosyltransferase